MDWDKIETMWADMTRRVQADWHPRGDSAAGKGAFSTDPADAPALLPAVPGIATAIDAAESVTIE